MYKKILSMLLSLCMVFSVTSGALTAFAYNGDKATGKKTTTNVTVVNEDQKTVSQSDESILSLKYYTANNVVSASHSMKTLLGIPEGTENLASLDKMSAYFYKADDKSYKKSTNISDGARLFDDTLGSTAGAAVYSDICKEGAGSPMQYKDADGNYNPVTDGSVTLNLIFDLKDVYDISDFVLSYNPSYHAGRYEVYTSKEIGQLFNATPLVDSTSTNAGNNNGNFKVDSYKVQADANVYARYVAFRFYGTTYGNPNSAAYVYDRLRMDEIGIYGTKAETKGINTFVTADNDRVIDTIYPSIVQSGTYSWNAPFSTDNSRLTGSGAIPGKLYDSDVAQEFYNETSSAWFASGDTVMIDDEYYIDFVYEVDSSVSIANIQLAHNTTNGIKTGRYVIYASDDRSTLFDDENIIVDYDNSTLVGTNDAVVQGNSTSYQKFTFNNGDLSASYVAVRVYDPCNYISNQQGAFTYPSADKAQVYYRLRLNEFNVYGYAGASALSVSGKNGSYQSYMNEVDIANSLIADKDRVYAKYINVDSGVTTPKNLVISESTTRDASGNTRIVTLTDSTEINGNILVGSGKQLNFAAFDENNKVIGIINDENREYAEFAYDLGALTSVENISFFGHPQDMFTPYKYRLSFANSAEDLFTDNAVYTSNVLTNRNNYVMITVDEEIKARYVAMRIICGITPSAVGTAYGATAYYARMCHFDVFGTPAESTYNVCFVGKDGTLYNEFNVVAETALTAEQLATVTEPEIYGYVFKGWDGDITAPITTDTVFTPVFEKATDVTYTVNYALQDGTTGSEVHYFDDRINLNDDAAKAWYNEDNVLLAVGTNAVFYVYGDMTVKSTQEDLAPTAPTVSILNTAVTEKADSYNYNVFIHAYTMDQDVEEIGVVFLSKTQYVKLSSDDEFTIENLDNKGIHYLETSGDTYDNFLGTLVGVTKANQVTRYARAYVVVGGVTYYSNVVFNTFNAQ